MSPSALADGAVADTTFYLANITQVGKSDNGFNHH
ncbi:hypothetical protein EPYR_01330 [Erwinia pyrifoliae DSM 12163]|nr:hypothetical protein EPYR_01330 [Erwinia pyrifoliae DSM 12163]